MNAWDDAGARFELPGRHRSRSEEQSAESARGDGARDAWPDGEVFADDVDVHALDVLARGRVGLDGGRRDVGVRRRHVLDLRVLDAGLVTHGGVVERAVGAPEALLAVETALTAVVAALEAAVPAVATSEKPIAARSRIARRRCSSAPARASRAAGWWPVARRPRWPRAGWGCWPPCR